MSLGRIPHRLHSLSLSSASVHSSSSVKVSASRCSKLSLTRGCAQIPCIWTRAALDSPNSQHDHDAASSITSACSGLTPSTALRAERTSWAELNPGDILTSLGYYPNTPGCCWTGSANLQIATSAPGSAASTLSGYTRDCDSARRNSQVFCAGHNHVLRDGRCCGQKLKGFQ